MYKRQVGSFLIGIAFLAVAAAGILNIQLIKDYAQFYQYKPSDMIASFVGQTGMSEHGKFLFYVSQPSLEGAETFNSKCGESEKTAAILGCYDGEKIYVYDITDPRLSGIRPTTAAHEMLHAAYHRLNGKDKQAVDTLLETEYGRLKKNKEFSDRMALYKGAQSSDQNNELHSIIGTEVAEISTELEAYYSRYFADRSKVIAQHKQYHSLFIELKAKADKLSAQTSQLAETIQNKRTSYEAQAVIMQRDITSFNARAARGDFDSQAEFNSERQALINRSATLENLRSEINNDIAYYNSLVAELNGIAVETDALNRSIDSSVDPAPSL